MQVSSLAALGGVMLLATSASAATVLFDDDFANGAGAFTAGGTAATEVTAPEPVFAGTESLKLAFTGDFTQAGIIGGIGVVPQDTVLRFQAYRDFGSATLTLRLGGSLSALELGNGAPERAFVTVNGQPAPATGQILPQDAWADVVVNLRGITSSSVGAFTFKNTSSDATVYLDNVRLEVIPEPATLGLIGTGLLALRRRRA